ncbi:MAG: septum formation initiator family protein [Clostridium sp.]|nr:septum formation initiator family protein [Clostridium sp.]MCM1444544.1 septum formation initiator family protein [Candidatus Amulumruptor caecigallinarius]
MKRKISKKSKRRLVVLGIPSILIIIYGVFTISYYGIAMFKVKSENKSLETELKTLQNSEENLRLEIQKLKDPEYIARYARENYFYSKDGEKILKLESLSKDDSKEKQVEQTNNTYLIIISVCFGLILVVVIIRKKKPAEI